MSNSLVEITSSQLDFGGKKKAVLLFVASWHDGCPPLAAVLSALTGTAPDVFFGKIDAEQVSDLADRYQVTMVPTIVLLNGKHVSERMEGGFDPSQVTIAVQRLLSAVEASAAAATSTPVTTSRVDPEKDLAARLDSLVKTDTVMLFMKGEPSAPRCGFSRQVVELLQENQIPFGSFDILTDDTVRQGLKKHSNWPTYPQIYVKGELIGGLDILKEIAEEGPLKEQWGITMPSTTISPLQVRLANLLKRSNVMVC
jgi:Grx4 family monothiol glutaredoxin